MAVKPEKKHDVRLRPKVAYHEAGHAIVGQLVGFHIRKLQLFDSGPLAGAYHTKPVHCVDRTHAVQILAGPMAEIKHQRDAERRGFASAQERKSYERTWKTQLSLLHPVREPHNVAGDYQQALAALGMTVMQRRIGRIIKKHGLENPEGLTALMNPDQDAIDRELLREIVWAERTACRILKANWGTLCKVAEALLASKTGVLERKKFLNIVGSSLVVPAPNLSLGPNWYLGGPRKSEDDDVDEAFEARVRERRAARAKAANQ
jgi:hypothetical protein